VEGDNDPLGGHIHFGIPPSRELLQMLDAFIGIPLKSESGKARNYYGHLGDYEVKKWGFEYRTPPSAWLCFPEVARIVLKIARGVANYYMNHDRIKYHRRPIYDDYKRICKLTRREYSIFRKFITGKLRKYYVSILGNWGIERVDGDKIIIEFSDEWNDPEIKEIFLSSLSLTISKPVAVRLFGLREDRGREVYGFSCPGYRHTRDISRSRFHYGVPKFMRDGKAPREEVHFLVSYLKAKLLVDLEKCGIYVVEPRKLKRRRRKDSIPRKVGV
jgi:hypothetical protein